MKGTNTTMTQANATRSVKDWKRKAWGDTRAADVTGATLFRIEMRHFVGSFFAQPGKKEPTKEGKYHAAAG
jgi:hypothetical protein